MSLRHAVLGLLADQGAASGYDLLKRFEGSLANIWPATQSQLYGELGKLTTDGLIEISAEGARGRKEYEITESGRTELRHWMTEVLPVPVKRDETMLRVFLLGTIEPEQRRRFLTDAATRLRTRLAELEDLERRIDWNDDDLSTYGHLVLDWGQRFMAMRADWFTDVAEHIDRPAAAAPTGSAPTSPSPGPSSAS
ncbi:PadR family transcriptional regulator [Nocardia vermiculata]|uniref:PadR family transcriptional regulator n=1 Tax=Nocardia vermiculata TaxID=257274 RepID=A0A846XSK4_9NOCA|nr:PadR family transcriptional regulator [Nocardia vermiculata]NKY50056.1 PadR family transcriptional regulator [Nocardia vermiculata]